MDKNLKICLKININTINKQTSIFAKLKYKKYHKYSGNHLYLSKINWHIFKAEHCTMPMIVSIYFLEGWILSKKHHKIISPFPPTLPSPSDCLVL